MRCVWVLVIGCLVAATAVRPQVELRDPHAAKIDVAPASIAVVARREATHLPELKLSAFVAAASAVIASPVLVAVDTSWRSVTPVAACAADTACARGPPIA